MQVMLAVHGTGSKLRETASDRMKNWFSRARQWFDHDHGECGTPHCSVLLGDRPPLFSLHLAKKAGDVAACFFRGDGGFTAFGVVLFDRDAFR